MQVLGGGEEVGMFDCLLGLSLRAAPGADESNVNATSLLCSARDMGVAEWSTDTTERTGKTRSTAPGVRVLCGPSYLREVGDAGGSEWFPKMFAVV